MQTFLLRNCFCFFCLIPNILQIKFRFTFETSWTLRTKVTFWNAFYTYLFWFLCFLLDSGPRVPLSPSRSINLWWNSISPVSVVSHPAPNSTLQGSKLHRLSVHVNRSICVWLCLCVCELCVTASLSPFSLSIGWLLNSSSTAAAWAICDIRYTIYTRQSKQQQFP